MITEGVLEIQKRKKEMGKNMGKYKTIFISFLNYFTLEAKKNITPPDVVLNIYIDENTKDNYISK